jgi:hypothetical protein
VQPRVPRAVHVAEGTAADALDQSQPSPVLRVITVVRRLALLRPRARPLRRAERLRPAPRGGWRTATAAGGARATRRGWRPGTERCRSGLAGVAAASRGTRLRRSLDTGSGGGGEPSA